MSKSKPNFLQKIVRQAVRDVINQINDKNSELSVSQPTKGTEAWYRNRLAKALNGKIEVQTEVGRIDVLTDTEVIEIKRVSGWKSAIGQVKSYGKYYPNHKLRIHLFGKLTSKKRDLIQKICQSEGIHLTWE